MKREALEISNVNNNGKISLSQYIFLVGLYIKQFYLLPSGSIQIGDFLLMAGCLLYIVFTLKCTLRISNDDKYIVWYVVLAAVINLLYSGFLQSSDFIRPIYYYIYNLIIILVTSSFLSAANNVSFLKSLYFIQVSSILTQFLLLISGVGRWAYSTRYSGTFNDPNQYSVFIFFLILSVYLLDHILCYKKWVKWCALGSFLVLPSTSTGTMLGLVVFWIGLYFSSVKRLNKNKRVLWGVVLLFIITLIVLLHYNVIALPSFIVNNKMYIRVMGKIGKVSGESDFGGLLSDRGWTRILKNPQYILYGAGEGGFKRFDTYLEIHSSLLGPLFYYGVVPFALFVTWVLRHIKKTRYKFIYIAMFSEAIFLVNTRQPMYWLLILLASVSICDKKGELGLWKKCI